ncbi:hypothetical protein [Pseudomonas protegens]|uniref:hypothetical protein n=1 Tax=Pseudomonas protegens TaxID=380021 RepID=UPI001B31C803|nr:hypothetical protein [Pseudomonas protegens]MBP5120996.1 hypothetical protein [Pseudomonas protegens]
MSDEDDFENEITVRVRRLHAYKLGDFLAHIQRRKLDRPCESCGSKKWATPCDENAKPTMLQMEIADPDEGVQLYITRICQVCANTRFYNVGWLISDHMSTDDNDE